MLNSNSHLRRTVDLSLVYISIDKNINTALDFFLWGVIIKCIYTVAALLVIECCSVKLAKRYSARWAIIGYLQDLRIFWDCINISWFPFHSPLEHV